MPTSAFVLHTRCVDGAGPAFVDKLNDMTDRAREITPSTFFKHVKEPVAVAATGADYQIGARAIPGRFQLRLKDDRCVRFYRSKFEGKPCYYLVWSAVEHVFLSLTDSRELRHSA